MGRLERCVAGFSAFGLPHSNHGKRKDWGTSLVLGAAFSRFLLWALLVLLCPWSLADTNVGGALTADTVWTSNQSPYVVTADLAVQAGATLTINPGVLVYMAPGTNMVVNGGALIAVGSAGSPIKIQSQSRQQGGAASKGSWGNLSLLSAGTGSRLDFVQIEDGKGLIVNNAAPTLNHLLIGNHQGAAIAIDLDASPSGEGNQAVGNDQDAIVVPAGAINGQVTWGLKGIPYLVASGLVSVGIPPGITAISPNEFQQGRSTDAVISGVRLEGADLVTTDSPLVGVALKGPSGPTTSIVTVSPAVNAPLGNVGLVLRTAAGEVKADGLLKVVPYLGDIQVTGILPGSMRQGDTKDFVISGALLDGASVVSNQPALAVSNVVTTATQIQLKLTASNNAPLGDQTFQISNPGKATGTAMATVRIDKALPKISVLPSPVVIALNQLGSEITIQLSEAADQDYVLTLTFGDNQFATLSKSQIAMAKGQSSDKVVMTGSAVGVTQLTVTADKILAPVTVPVTVTPDYTKGNFISAAVGVVKENTSYLGAAPAVGVVKENGSNLGVSPLVGVIKEADLLFTDLPLVAPPVGVKKDK